MQISRARDITLWVACQTVNQTVSAHRSIIGIRRVRRKSRYVGCVLGEIMITQLCVIATTNAILRWCLGDAMRSPNGYAVRDVDGYQEASDVKSEIGPNQ